MADTMQFDLVSPERKLLSAEVTAVQIPAAEGYMTVMPNHALTITTLRPGILAVETTQGTQEFLVTGGFAEIGESTSVLAEKALPKADVDQATYETLVNEAHATYTSSRDAAEVDHSALAEAAQLLQDMVAVGGHIGLDTHQPSL